MMLISANFQIKFSDKTFKNISDSTLFVPDVSHIFRYYFRKRYIKIHRSPMIGQYPFCPRSSGPGEKHTKILSLVYPRLNILGSHSVNTGIPTYNGCFVLACEDQIRQIRRLKNNLRCENYSHSANFLLIDTMVVLFKNLKIRSIL